MVPQPLSHTKMDWYTRLLQPQRVAATAFIAGCFLLSAMRAQSQFLPHYSAFAALPVAALPDAPQPKVQDPNPSAQEEVTVRNSPSIFLHDEIAIWTSPARLRLHDLKWIAPLALATGAAFATDNRTMVTVVSHDPSFNSANVNVSDALVGGLIATPVALFAAGEIGHDDRARETGILGGEALADGLVVSEVFKVVSWRVRPSIDGARGQFFQSSAGIDGSFDSMHTTLAFSAASVIASEYHSPWVQVAAYTGATAVGVTRVLGQQHFPSDVIIGATTGWLIGHYVVKHHHHARH